MCVFGWGDGRSVWSAVGDDGWGLVVMVGTDYLLVLSVTARLLLSARA